MKRKLVVLLADDDPNALRLARQAVEREQIEVELHTVQDGEEVIRYLSGEGAYAERKAHPLPDLIIVDLKMQRTDGLQVLDWLRAHPEFGWIPRVMLSGSGLERDVKEA